MIRSKVMVKILKKTVKNIFKQNFAIFVNLLFYMLKISYRNVKLSGLGLFWTEKTILLMKFPICIENCIFHEKN
jgi:hypothetical protein